MGAPNTRMLLEVYSKWIDNDQFDDKELAELDDFVTALSPDPENDSVCD